MARVGNDLFGQKIRLELEKNGVNTKRLVSINGKTGMAFIAVEPNGERSIYTFMGSNSNFKFEKEDISLIKHSEILHITGMYIEVVEEASKHAKLLSFSPGNILASYGLDALYQILKKTHILFLNKKEVTLLTGGNYDEGAKFIVDNGVPFVVVTLGKEGSKVYTKNKYVHCPARKLKAIDTTGAGDSFAAGFITAFFKKNNLKDCLKLGTQSASTCIKKFGGF